MLTSRYMEADETELYRRTGLTHQGPGLVYGLFLLAIAVIPYFLFDGQPWKTIVLVNAATNLVTGFAWTMVETRISRPFKQLGIMVWSLTTIVAQVLLALAIIFLIF